MKKKILACLLILFPIFSLGMAKADTVKIVSDTAYAPFEFKDSDQTYKGIDVDIINKVAEIKGWNIQMSYPGFDAAVNAVQSGQADAIMAGMTKQKNVKMSLPCLILIMIQKLSLLRQRQIKSPNMRNLAEKQLELRTELPLNVSSKVSKINTVSLLKPLIQVI